MNIFAGVRIFTARIPTLLAITLMGNTQRASLAGRMKDEETNRSLMLLCLTEKQKLMDS